MHHRGVATGLMGRHRIAAGRRQQPRDECAAHLANWATAPGCGPAVLAAVIHGGVTDKPRLHTLEMQVTKRLASLARASKEKGCFFPRRVPLVGECGFSSGRNLR